jgi:hypothetical protein
MDNYVTFTAGIFRSVRFGASSAHGIANLVRYNFFKEKEAFARDENGVYTVNPEKMQLAIDELSNVILKIQGDGDYDAAVNLVEKYGVVDAELEADLAAINAKKIPVDIVFNQGAQLAGVED